MKNIKEELNKWRDTPCSWIERFNIVKISLLPNFIYKFNAVLVEIPASCFVDTDKLNSKVNMERQKTQNSQYNNEGEEQSWRTGATLVQDLLLSYSNQDSLLLAK